MSDFLLGEAEDRYIICLNREMKILDKNMLKK
jgi:hypothetical protein